MRLLRDKGVGRLSLVEYQDGEVPYFCSSMSLHHWSTSLACFALVALTHLIAAELVYPLRLLSL
jgi:hypothetical protein